MPSFETGIVEEVIEKAEGLQRVRVRVGNEVRPAVLFTRFAAPAEAGDRVVLNTTATRLGLGSGGEDFVVWNLAHDSYETDAGGHIMKLRYTPMQTEVLAVEAPESPHHDAMTSATSLDGIPVLAASLHSQLLPVVVGLRMRRPDARIAYVMTDGGALDAVYSNTTRRLRELGWVDTVITVGHAFGGDLEGVNVYSGLLAARHITGADAVVVGMGPGVVGTTTTFGTSALELGMTLNATASLGGRPIAVVRMSSADDRQRHAGVSHHAMTALTRVAMVRVDVPVPEGHAEDLEWTTHNVVEVDVAGLSEALSRAEGSGLTASHMGRGPQDDRLFFLAAGAAGIHAGGLLKEG